MSETTICSSASAGSDDRFSLTRRGLMFRTAAAFAMVPAGPAAANPDPELSVTEALRARRSVRAFSNRPVEPPLLAELLWAAFGVNRDAAGLHTAPSWRGAADITVHVASTDGVHAYAPDHNVLRPRLQHDIRGLLSPQPFVSTAPVCLVHISDLRKLSATELDDQKRLYAQVDAALIAQNVYLFAAAKGLGTCLVGGFDRPAIVEVMKLPAHEFPAFVQPVGWPA